ncbi:MAG: tetratricopeptide repeat protein [Pseudomonadota bacterium]
MAVGSVVFFGFVVGLNSASAQTSPSASGDAATLSERMGSFDKPMDGPALDTPLTAAPSKADDQKTKTSSSNNGAEIGSDMTMDGVPDADEGTSNGLSSDQSEDPGADLAYGAFQRGFYLTAFKLALPRAETGDPAAQTLIAELYWNGFGIGRDQKKAVDWYRFAAEAGNREAQFAYANILLRGKVVPLDKETGTRFMLAAAKQNHPQANFNYAQILTASRPTYGGFKAALPYYRFAADAGISDAQYALATMHAQAQGVPYNDFEEARKWMQRAAEGGFDTAQVELGIWLATGKGGGKDEGAAFRWFSRAALAGNAIAQNRLAHMLANGVGAGRDVIRASAWHIISRRAGFNDSKMELLFSSMEEIDQRRALEAANQLSKRLNRRG